MSESLRRLLCELGREVALRVVAGRDAADPADLARVAQETEADVLYGIDRFGEEAVEEWFARHWPRNEPVRIVMEGVDDDALLVAPVGTPPDRVRWVCIIDPIDGTRGLMYDKRSAWVLAALAPADPDARGRPGARLGDVTVASMTEVPTTKQWRADQYSAVRGAGPSGVHGSGLCRDGSRVALLPQPSGARDVLHGFASFSHFFPDGMHRLAAIEQRTWDALLPPGDEPRPVFEDQYLCNAGQLHEVLVGHDRFVADLRPLVVDPERPDALTASHPYDVCSALVLTEAGGVFEDPWGRPVDAPLDTTTPVAWVAYANRALAESIRPALVSALEAEGMRPT